MNSETGKTYELMLTRIIDAPPENVYLGWTVTHRQMGFHEGWGQCADQLAALAAKL
jgi:uncharacterized protein YndB with AHSA1/START domain